MTPSYVYAGVTNLSHLGVSQAAASVSRVLSRPCHEHTLARSDLSRVLSHDVSHRLTCARCDTTPPLYEVSRVTARRASGHGRVKR